MSQPDLMSTPQAATRLKVSTRTVHRLVTAGRLTPAITAPGGPHGSYLFNTVDVEQLASDMSPQNPAGAPVADGAGEVAGTTPDAPTSPESQLIEGASS